KALESARPSRAATERTGRPDRCVPMPAPARRRRHRAAPNAPEHPSPVALGRCLERVSKCASSLSKPLSQTNLRNLPLLLRCFLKFGVVVILDPALQNIQNLRWRLAGRAHDEDAL